MELLNGANIEYNWSAISQMEWRILVDKETDEETNDLIVGKLVGMTAEELTSLSPVDYQRIAMGLFPSFREAVNTDSSKNLAGESTSE